MARPGVIPPFRHPQRGLGFITAGAIFAIDQMTKSAVRDYIRLPIYGTIELTSFFDLKWVENYGVSMGFLVADSNLGRWLLVALTSTIALGVTFWIWRERVKGDAFALGLILGGAGGNILDRVRFGHVVDFLDLHFGDWHPFLVFNVADAAITIGVLLLVLRALLMPGKKNDPAENANA